MNTSGLPVNPPVRHGYHDRRNRKDTPSDEWVANGEQGTNAGANAARDADAAAAVASDWRPAPRPRRDE